MTRTANATGSNLRKASLQIQEGNFRLAENTLKKIVRKEPHNAHALYLLSQAYFRQGKRDRCLACLENAIEFDPENVQFRYDLANILKAANRYPEAIEQYETAISLNGKIAEFHNNLGSALLATGELERADSCFRKALELNPGIPQPYLNIGNIHRERKELDQAIEFYKKALEKAPDYAEAHNNLGHVALELKRSDEAMNYFRKAVSIVPDLYEANANLSFQEAECCDWSARDDRLGLLDRLTRQAIGDGRKPPVTPFHHLSISDDLSLQLQLARCWSNDSAQKMAEYVGEFTHSKKASRGDRISVGYFSHDFRDHPVGSIAARFFELHDRDCFEVSALSFGADDLSAIRKKIEGTADGFLDLEKLSDIEAARAIRDKGIDILVDMTGFTQGLRMEITAVRPAPIQVNYLGYAGTLGSEFTDYIIADSFICPPEHAPHYSEKIVSLPDCYMACPYPLNSVEVDIDRRAANLPENGVVFSSFNRGYKINPEIFAVWMGILHEIEDSVIWLEDNNRNMRENLRREAKSAGIAEERIVFSDWVPDARQHLARLQLADIALDTPVYNGHVTTIDALYAGVPVVAVAGNHFPSRVAASMLHSAGLGELVASGTDEYRAMAVGLARDVEARTSLRETILARRETHPLFDFERLVRNLEKAYLAIWENYVAGRPPAPIALSGG